jgi:hypothetical protein
MKRIFSALLLSIVTSTAFAAEMSAPFFIAVTGRVCDSQNKCQRYNGDRGNVQVELHNASGGSSGTFEISYEIEGVKVVNKISLSTYEFNGELQTEVYVQISNSTSKLSTSGVSLKITSVEQMPWFSPDGSGFLANGKTVFPEIAIGPAANP